MAINIALTIKKELKTREIILGSKRTFKKINSIDKIYIAKDCPENIKKKIEENSKKYKIDIILLEFSKEELRDLCKKPFNISVLSILSGKKTQKKPTEEKPTKEKKEKPKKEKLTKEKQKEQKTKKKQMKNKDKKK